MHPDQPAHQEERERFPEIAERIGEDPARWLDQPLGDRGPSHTAVGGRLSAFARIRGIDYVHVAVAWIEVERQLERGPRQEIVDALKERIGWLNQQGDRDERIDLEAIEARSDPEPRTAAEYEAMPTRTPKLPEHHIWGSPTERLAERARERAATDGGEEGSE